MMKSFIQYTNKCKIFLVGCELHKHYLIRNAIIFQRVEVYVPRCMWLKISKIDEKYFLKMIIVYFLRHQAARKKKT